MGTGCGDLVRMSSTGTGMLVRGTAIWCGVVVIGTYVKVRVQECGCDVWQYGAVLL